MMRADLGRRVVVTLALATLLGEVPYEVFVGVAQDVALRGGSPYIGWRPAT